MIPCAWHGLSLDSSAILSPSVSLWEAAPSQLSCLCNPSLLCTTCPSLFCCIILSRFAYLCPRLCPASTGVQGFCSPFCTLKAGIILSNCLLSERTQQNQYVSRNTGFDVFCLYTCVLLVAEEMILLFNKHFIMTKVKETWESSVPATRSFCFGGLKVARGGCSHSVLCPAVWGLGVFALLLRKCGCWGVHVCAVHSLPCYFMVTHVSCSDWIRNRTVVDL